MKIGDVERLTGVAAATIRYWEDRGCINSTRTDNRYRKYTQDDIDLIIKIKQLREIGVPVADIKLWIDNLISTKKLLTEHLKNLDLNADENKKKRYLTQQLLDGNEPQTSIEIFNENENIPIGDLALGVDIGTTTISAQLISLTDNSCVHTYCIEHGAAIKDYAYPDAFAVDADSLCNIAISLVKSAINVYSNITSIGFTGQMHGIVCLGEDGEILSPLYTWQNQFGSRLIDGKTISELIEKKTGKKYPTGYGLVTYYALNQLGLLPENTKKIACISDVAVMRLCGNASPNCHPTNAASLGFFDIKNNCFQYDLLEKIGIEKNVLPELVSDYHICGKFEGASVSVSIGDNQAGALASISDACVLLNIGTSGQICLIEANPDFEKFNNTLSVELRPYFDNKYLYVGSTLCGGRALAALADFIFEACEKLDAGIRKPDIYRLINSSAMEATGELKISTEFLGTRDNPEQKGRIENISLNSFNLAELSAGFSKGIISELYGLYGKFRCTPPDRLVVSGNAIRKNIALCAAAEQVFGVAATMPKFIEEAAFGAAIYSVKSAVLLKSRPIEK